jgi:hypothetical protein
LRPLRRTENRWRERQRWETKPESISTTFRWRVKRMEGLNNRQNKKRKSSTNYDQRSKYTTNPKA